MIVLSYISRLFLSGTQKNQDEWLVFQRLILVMIDCFESIPAKSGFESFWVLRFKLEIAILSKIEEDSIFLESENSFVEDQGKLHPTQKGALLCFPQYYPTYF